MRKKEKESQTNTLVCNISKKRNKEEDNETYKKNLLNFEGTYKEKKITDNEEKSTSSKFYGDRILKNGFIHLKRKKWQVTKIKTKKY